MFKKGQILVYLLVVALVALLSVNASSIEVQKHEIRFGTSPMGGNWPTLGNVMLEDILKANPNLSGSTVPLGGAANVVGVHQGKANIAFTKPDMLADAWEGREPFKSQGQMRNIRVLASLYPEMTQFCVYADSGITKVEQLKGKRVTPGPKGSSIEILTGRILECYGMSTKDVVWRPLSFADGADQMLDHHLDAILYGAIGYPVPSIVNISSQRQIRLLSLSDEVIAKMVKTYKGISPYTLKAGSYKGVDYPVKGIAINVILIVREDMPEDVAYGITKTLAENFDNYGTVVKAMALGKRNDMGADVGFPHHPGTLKYYKEQGWVK